MNPLIRDYSESDFDDVNNIWNETGMGGRQRGDDKKTIADTLNCGGKLLVLENKDSGEIIGTSWLTNDGRRIYLHHFGLKPAFQGKGLSNLLLESSLKFAKSKGLQIKLEVHKNNEVAINLYKKYGFKYLGDYLIFIIRDINN
jgi:ribosomal protein S18 acetylase RimI-like enzyme